MVLLSGIILMDLRVCVEHFREILGGLGCLDICTVNRACESFIVPQAASTEVCLKLMSHDQTYASQ